MVGKFSRSLKSYPIILFVAGLGVGIAIGWFLGARSEVKRISPPAAKATAYTNRSDDELKNRSIQLVSAIRELTRSYYQEDDKLRKTSDENSARVSSQAERDRIRQTWIDESAKLHAEFLDRYKRNYWADAILLRHAIVAKIGGAPGAQNPMLFQHPTNMLGVEQVANSLELLGKSLPAQR
jgi:hypothetical protein